MNLNENISNIKKLMNICELVSERFKNLHNSVKNLVDTYQYPGLDKITFDLEYNKTYGFYEITPKFYFNVHKMHPQDVNVPVPFFKTYHSNKLLERIESYLGIHIVSHTCEIIFFHEMN